MMKEKALLVISFGTSYVQTRERTIGATERKLAERFPDRDVRRARTSNFIIKKVAKIKFFQQGKFKNQAFFGSSAKWIGGVV